MSDSFAYELLQQQLVEVTRDRDRAHAAISRFVDSRDTPGLFPTREEMLEQDDAWDDLFRIHKRVSGKRT